MMGLPVSSTIAFCLIHLRQSLLWYLEFANFWRGWELASPSNLLESPPLNIHTVLGLQV